MDSITIELAEGISQLRAIQGLFNASEFVTREEFEKFVAGFLEEPHGVQALEWILRVPASQKEQHIQSIRQEGFEDFDIHPETPFKDIFPVTYLAPFSGNAAALGFDLYSEEVRRAALIKAWETGELAITDPITLVQETGTQSAFLAYAPIYSSKDIPRTLQERQDLLVGFGLGVVRFGDFIDHALPASFDPSIGVTVVDPDHPARGLVLYTNLEIEIHESALEDLEVIRSVAVADEVWAFHFTAPLGYGLGAFEKVAWIIVLVLGLIFSTIILIIVILLFKSRQAALALSVERHQSEDSQRTLAQELIQLIDTANAPIFGVDMEGMINEWNQMVAELTGFSKDEVMGRNLVEEVIAEEYRATVKEVQDKAMNGEDTASFELPLYTKNGERVVVLLNATSRRDVTDKIIGVIGIGQDITERKQSEEKLVSIATELTQLIETANNPIFGVDAEGLVNVWNQAMVNITGVSDTDAAGQPALRFISDRSRTEAQERIQAVLSGESCENFEVDILSPMEESITLLLNCTSRRGSAGNIIGAIAVGLDISERLRAEQEIRALNRSLEDRVAVRTRELEEAAEELESFSYSVSHDLRGPLRSINGFSLAVLERYGEKLEDQGRSYLERVRQATDRMGRLIDDLLALSRVGRAELIPEPLDLGKMV